MPGEHVGEDAAQEHAGGPSPGEDEPDDAHRLRTLGGLGEEDHDQRERDHRDDRAAEALHRPRPDEGLLRGRQAAGERGQGEDGDADQKEAAVAKEVAEAAAEEKEAAESEQIGVDHPGERGLGETQIGSDRGKGDVHDRRVEHDHEIAETENDSASQRCRPDKLTVLPRSDHRS